MTKRRAAFTLVELLIVMGIIILFITMAIPTVRSLTGGNSIAMAVNVLSSIISRAREEAVGAQDIRGVMLYLDQNTNRVVAVIVQDAPLQSVNWPGYTLLDVVPSSDSVTLPYGVGVQAVINGYDPSATLGNTAGATTAMSNAANGLSDRYMGFDTIGSVQSMNSPSAPLVGTVILFDGNGKLLATPYAFQMAAPGTGAGVPPASNLAKLLQIDMSFSSDSNIANSGVYVVAPGQQKAMPLPANFPIQSQVAIVLYDSDTFASLGFTYSDWIFQNGGVASYTTAWPTTNGGNGVASESDEEIWLDNNTTPIMINRQNGTLIRGE